MQLGIPHRVVDLSGVFRDWVVAPFLRDYACGRTPNPCLRCNQVVKFGALLELALAAGCGHLATGHYARADVADGRHQLLMAADGRKDQSYFLYGLQQEQLGVALFPWGTGPRSACANTPPRADWRRPIAREPGRVLSVRR